MIVMLYHKSGFESECKLRFLFRPYGQKYGDLFAHMHPKNLKDVFCLDEFIFSQMSKNTEYERLKKVIHVYF